MLICECNQGRQVLEHKQLIIFPLIIEAALGVSPDAVSLFKTALFGDLNYGTLLNSNILRKVSPCVSENGDANSVAVFILNAYWKVFVENKLTNLNFFL